MSEKNLKAFLGRLTIEIIREDGKESLKKQLIADGKMSENSVIEIPDAQFYEDVADGKIRSKEWGTPQIRYGKVLDMSPDCFGELFKRSYGADRDEYPEIGDIVYFVPGTTYQINSEGMIHFLDDCKVVGYIKTKKESTV